MHTIYINGINEKISPNKLKRVLEKICSRYGQVVQVTAHGNLRMKGQAFVSFADEKSSEKAVEKLKGYPLFKKPISVTFATSESDQVHLQRNEEEKVAQRKLQKEQRQKSQPKPKVSKISRAQVSYWRLLPAHNVLLLQNIPDELCTDGLQETLQEKFGGFGGLESIRAIKPRNLAFVHFETQEQASSCLQSFDTTTLAEDLLFTYAKK